MAAITKGTFGKAHSVCITVDVHTSGVSTRWGSTFTSHKLVCKVESSTSSYHQIPCHFSSQVGFVLEVCSFYDCDQLTMSTASQKST